MVKCVPKDQLFNFPCFSLPAEGMVVDDRGSLILGPWVGMSWGRLSRWARNLRKQALLCTFFTQFLTH